MFFFLSLHLSYVIQPFVFVLHLVFPLLQRPERGIGRRQGEASGASAPPALVQPGTERGAGRGPPLDSTAHYPTGDWHTGGNLQSHTQNAQMYLSLYSPDHRFKCIFVSHRVVWAAAQSQGTPTRLSLLLLTARALWRALSRTPLALWLTLEKLWNQKNQPPSSQHNSRDRNLVNSNHAFLLTNAKERVVVL